jgi:hypothetical protein
MKKPIKDYITKLEAMADELVELRESKANPCDEENAEGRCPCDTFDQALDHVNHARQILETL